MLDSKKLEQLLISQNYLTKEDLAQAQKIALSYKISLYEALQTENLISRTVLGQAIAEHYKVLYLNLAEENVDKELLGLIPESVARTYQFMPVNKVKGKVKLAMIDPSDLAALHLAEKKIGDRIVPYLVLPEDFEQAFSFYGEGIAEAFAKIVKIINNPDTGRDERDEATIKVVDLLLDKGYRAKASDIHIEPTTKDTLVRFRIDGVLHQELKIDKDLTSLILARIKVMARLRTDEHRSAQDGKLRFKVDKQAVDVRVSIVPITEGENVVLRLLAANTQNLTLTNLGFAEKDLAKVKKAIKRPHGMLLITGPTGSGKTTSLYAVLNILNRSEVHIATIEDPVEYAVEGVSQIQVDNKTNLTFAAGLRSILRQDPDIIMVGEIRDKETAGISVNAALTGHLVLSSLHTNNAPSALPRLIDMDIEPFLVASTVNIIIAQRLVRKNCEKCRESVLLTKEEKMFIKNDSNIKQFFVKHGHKDIDKLNVYRGKGCKACDKTGYSGRIGVFEVLEISDQLKKMIMNKRDATEIEELAKKQGMTTMMEDGLAKVLAGLTSLDEVLRVTRD